MILSLRPHPATPPIAVRAVDVELSMADGDDILLSYKVTGTSGLVVPEPATPARVHGLWRTTCFECFLRPKDSEDYFEFNFSPSGNWAAYHFADYRNGGRDLVMAITPWVGRNEEVTDADTYVCDAGLDITEIPTGPVRMGLSAVIEEVDGTKSYWALAHPPGAPDFHHPDCFALELPPPPRP